ncbi:hypothetical protein ScPMuIL_004180 [Solemya velum]
MFFLVLFAVLGSTVALPPSPCCLSPQHEYFAETVGAYVNASEFNNPDARTSREGSYHYYYDGLNMKQAIVSRLWKPDGTFASTRTILLYNEGVSYSIDQDTGSCIRTGFPPGTAMTPRCVADNATLLASTEFGVPPKDISTNTWAWKVGSLDIRSINTADDCTPLMTGWYYTIDGTSAAVTTMMTNYHAGIRDQSVFSVVGYNCPTS